MAVSIIEVREIAGHIRQASRTCFITGAGASLAAGIPSASKLVEIIQRDFGYCLTGMSADDKKSYGRVMGRLSPADRKVLIQPLLEKAGVNWGNLALASMVRGNFVQRVLTFNFDMIIEKSSNLLGLQLPVYDFGVAPTREIDRLAMPSIIHLHGQSYGLAQLNTDKETAEHAAALSPLLRDTVTNHLTIVIGYSGEADSAFPVIADSFNSFHRLIWLGHDKSPAAHLKPLLDKDYAHYFGGCDYDLFMIDLAKELGQWPPMLISNPPQHLLDSLQDVTAFPVAPETGLDVLTLTRQRLAHYAERWQAEGGPNEQSLQGLVGQTADTPRGFDLALLTGDAKDAFAWTLIRNGNALAGEARTLTGDAARAKFAEAGQKFAQSLQIKPDKHEALNNWGSALAGEAGTLTGDAARAKFAEAGQKYAQALQIKPDMDEALSNWGIALDDEAGTLTGDAARAKFAEAGQKFAQALQIKPDKHPALSNWGTALGHLSHLQSGAERVATLAQAEALSVRWTELTGKADYNLACIHAQRGDAARAVAQLRGCQGDGTLPTPAHLDADRDFDLIRPDPLYQSFRAGLT